MHPIVAKASLFAALPPPWPEDLAYRIRAAVAARPEDKLVVLDDDPTGTQTVFDVPVLTGWDVTALRAEFARPGPCFYLLTNSRSLPSDGARELNREIARNLRLAAGPGRPFTVVSRSDSTLRGHYPIETDVLAQELGPFDATLLIFYFEAGGRYTVGDVHYVAEGEQLIPAAQTPFARDAAFGYRSSNLRDYVEEKTAGHIKASEVTSITIEDLRRGGPDAVAGKLLALPPGAVCIVNAAAQRDLEVFVAGLITAEDRGRRFLFRTAAQFVAARLGLEARPLWQPASRRPEGGLTVVGSYVPKTTEQLRRLLDAGEVAPMELSVPEVLAGAGQALDDVARQVNAHLGAGRDVVVFTSRELVTGQDPATNLAIGAKVSAVLAEIVRRLEVRPRYLLAKGGITASDLATRGLGVRRARVLGQILPGVPVWETGPETKYPGVPYVVFPGNVGGPDALLEATRKFNQQPT